MFWGDFLGNFDEEKPKKPEDPEAGEANAKTISIITKMITLTTATGGWYPPLRLGEQNYVIVKRCQKVHICM